MAPVHLQQLALRFVVVEHHIIRNYEEIVENHVFIVHTDPRMMMLFTAPQLISVNWSFSRGVIAKDP